MNEEEQALQPEEEKNNLNHKINIVLTMVFNNLDINEKKDLFGEENQEENNFNGFVNQIKSYFTDPLVNGSKFLMENKGSTAEAKRTGLFKFFLGPKITRTANVGENTYYFNYLMMDFMILPITIAFIPTPKEY